jgi:hypothetical protein
MDNVIEFPTNRSEEDGDPAAEFIMNDLIPWAIEQGLDIYAAKFRFNAATIMTCLQGMLLDDI